MNPTIAIDHTQIARFCRRWSIAELSVFGSALRDDFRPDSDIDVLVAFDPAADWSLFDHARMEEELTAILGRKADIVTRRAVERSDNWIRRSEILSGAEPLYAAR
jgi:predicted nucleotidyltransferase